VNTQKALESVARGEDLRDLLDHIAWTDTIKPELEKTRSRYEKALVASVLGQPIISGGKLVTSEQLAGRIEGINLIEGLFEKVLRQGVSAFQSMQQLENTVEIQH
jgi:hypothetical protein